MKRGLALFVVWLALFAGVRPTTDSPPTFVRIWLIGDLHYGGPVGGRWNGALRLRKIIAESKIRNPNKIVFDGDHQWDAYAYGDSLLDGIRDSLQWFFQDSLHVAIPTIGNHEVAFEDSASGFIYNNFTNRWPEFYRPYVDPTRRGSRWFRVDVGNVVILCAQNNRDVASGDAHYWVNNPKDGSGVALYDFDGISDSTSAQREAIAAVVRSLRRDQQLLFVWHRASHALNEAGGIRPELESGHGPADSSAVTQIDEILQRPWILMEADTHENKRLLMHGWHIALSSCNKPRTFEAAKIAQWSSYIAWAALQDTVIDNSGTALIDSLGATNNLQTDGGTDGAYCIVQEIDYHGFYADIKALMIQQGADQTAVVDSMRVQL